MGNWVLKGVLWGYFVQDVIAMGGNKLPVSAAIMVPRFVSQIFISKKSQYC
jgi:hypothetical protein